MFGASRTAEILLQQTAASFAIVAVTVRELCGSNRNLASTLPANPQLDCLQQDSLLQQLRFASYEINFHVWYKQKFCFNTYRNAKLDCLQQVLLSQQLPFASYEVSFHIWSQQKFCFDRLQQVSCAKSLDCPRILPSIQGSPAWLRTCTLQLLTLQI